jgi:maltooligosyltrehalose synthase
MTAFVRKASKEAKQETSWTTPNSGYERAVETFVRSMMTDDAFMEEMRRLCEQGRALRCRERSRDPLAATVLARRSGHLSGH